MPRVHVLGAMLVMACATGPQAFAQATRPPSAAAQDASGFTPLEQRKRNFFNHVDQFGTDSGVLDQKPRNPFLVGPDGLPIVKLPNAVKR